MMRRSVVPALLFLVAVATPARAQWAVIDPANLIQTTRIATTTLLEYQQLYAQTMTLYRMAQRMTDMHRYRVSPLQHVPHDLTQARMGRSLLEALNTGDPHGDLYDRAVSALPGVAFERLPPGVRQTLEQGYASIDVADAVGRRTIRQVGAVRQSGDDIARAIRVLEADVTSASDSMHALTMNLDKLAGGEVIGRRQDEATNQLLAAAMEQQVIRAKRTRDTEAAALRMRANGARDGATAQAALFAGSADALITWRQP